MSTNDTHSRKRNGSVQPKYLLLCVDQAGRDWLWRTNDDRVLVVDGDRLVRNRPLPTDATPEQLLAQVDADIGIARQHLAGSLAGALAINAGAR